jgi:hypothetical protein
MPQPRDISANPAIRKRYFAHSDFEGIDCRSA